MLKQYYKQINHLLKTSPNSVIKLINGEISFAKSEHLDMNDRIKLFEFFLFKSDIERQINDSILHNVKIVLLNILYSDNYRLYIYREGDLSPQSKKILDRLLLEVKDKDLKEQFIFKEDFENLRLTLNEHKSNGLGFQRREEDFIQYIK